MRPFQSIIFGAFLVLALSCRAVQQADAAANGSCESKSGTCGTSSEYTKFKEFEAMTDGWSETANKASKYDGFSVTTKTRTYKSKLTLAKHDILVENADASQIVDSFLNKWDKDPDAKEYKLVEKNGPTAVHYLRYAIPIPFVADRDILCKASSEEVAEGTFICIATVEHADQPEINKVVRMDMWVGGIVSKDGKNVKFTYYEYGDAYHALLNSFDASEVVDDMKEMVKEIQK